MSTPDANLALMRAAFAALARRDLDACVAMLAQDFLIDVAGAPVKRGRGAWRWNAGMLFAAFPDVAFHVEDMFAGDDKVAVRVRPTGTHTGDFLGHPPTGRRVDYKSNELYRIVDGQIAAEWICSDTLSLMTQTGGMSGARLFNPWLSGDRVAPAADAVRGRRGGGAPPTPKRGSQGRAGRWHRARPGAAPPAWTDRASRR